LAVVLVLIVNVAGLAISTALVDRERDRTAAALERERQRADEAERRFRQAKAMSDMLLRVSEEDLGASSPFQSTRRRLLQTALESYRDLQRNGPADPEVRAEIERIQKLLAVQAARQEAERVFLLRHPSVRAELALSPEQSEQIAAAFAPRGPAADVWGRMPDRETRDAIAELLTESQRVRLRQIALQFLGPGAFSDPDVIDGLALTASQRQQIRAIRAEAFTPAAGRRPVRAESPAKVLKRILDALTPEQRATWQEFVGVPFGTAPITSP
jgi:hypothetical protein